MRQLNKVIPIAILGFSLLIATPALATRSALLSQAAHPNIPATTSGQNGRMQACQARENSIKQRSNQLVQLAITMESKFDAIEKRVEDYYNSKVAPSGKTVPNYSSLVSDVQTKKAVVTTAVAKAQADASNFSCNTVDPKGQVTQFRIDMQAVKADLQDYRTSIKNLIVTIHSVTGTQNSSPEASGSGGTK